MSATKNSAPAGRSARRLWVYEVDEVWGWEDRPEPPVEVGSLIVGVRRSTWEFMNLRAEGGPKVIGGFRGVLLGEYVGPRSPDGRHAATGGPLVTNMKPTTKRGHEVAADA